MSHRRSFRIGDILPRLQLAGIVIVLGAGATLAICSILAAVGVLPWLQAPLQFGDMVLPNGGAVIQVSLALLLLTLAVFLPSTRRIAKLEATHRDFRLSMEDVARAYAAVHKADREGFFRFDHEFDAVRQRFAFLREHPDLELLEPELLEVASQMSVQSADLADKFSVEKVERARTFLRQRMQEIAAFEARIEQARKATRELASLHHEVTSRDDAVSKDGAQIERELRQALRDLGYDLTRRAKDPSVVQMPTAAE